MKRQFRLLGYIVLLVAVILVIGVLVLVFGRMDKVTEAYGLVAPARSVGVKPRFDGIIEKMLVGESDVVRAGDTVAILQADELTFEGEKARQALARAQAELAQLNEEYGNLMKSRSFETQSAFANLYQAKRMAEIAKEKYERAQELYANNLISAEERDDVRLNYELAESNLKALEERADLLERRYLLQIRQKEKEVELAKREFNLATERLGKSIITAPIAGEVLTPKAEALVGEKVSEGKAFLEIGDLAAMHFIAEVNESDLPHVKPGQEARILINAFPHRKFKTFDGEVVSISPTPKISGGGIVFEAELSIKDPTVRIGSSSLALRPGLSGKAKIVTKHDARLIEIIFGVRP